MMVVFAMIYESGPCDTIYAVIFPLTALLLPSLRDKASPTTSTTLDLVWVSSPFPCDYFIYRSKLKGPDTPEAHGPEMLDCIPMSHKLL